MTVMVEIPQTDILGAIMSDIALKLDNPPIVEAILDIDCDMPPGWELDSIESSAQAIFHDRYPKLQTQYFQRHTIEGKADAPPATSVHHGVSAYQFKSEDTKQLVQCRPRGFSFNRLAPYTDLDDYLPEIERCWKLYAHLISPVLIKQIRLRYINQLLIPLQGGKFDLDQYLRIGPRLPDENGMVLAGFLNQIAARDTQTGHTINIVLTNQQGDDNYLPVIFDNCVIASTEGHEPDDWNWMLEKIRELRVLKNRVFYESVTPKCLSLFQQQ